MSQRRLRNTIIILMDPDFTERPVAVLLEQLFLLFCCMGLAFLLMGVYHNLWRYADAREYLALAAGGLCGGLLYLVAALLLLPERRLSITFTALVTCSTLVLMLTARFTYCELRKRQLLSERRAGRTPVGIIGAGSAGLQLLSEMERVRRGEAYQPVCFLDDDTAKIGGRIRGVPVMGPIAELPRLLRENPVSELIIAIPALDFNRRREIIDLCSSRNIRVRILPDTLRFIRSEREDILATLRDIEIGDLLERPQITFDDEQVQALLRDKVILVTGGGGSIGAELCRQVAANHPRHLVILDIYENSAYEIQQELLQKYGGALALSVEIASICDRVKVEALFGRYHPQIVFHAAAHKHVPLMEDCPAEAIGNNVFGTLNVLRAATEFLAEQFVLISTDKAVNPTSVMGATKRLCEMLLQMYGHSTQTRFSAVRFGNVLGSHGSVIPLFQKQIACGGPVTVTHPEITRFFMTIPEATALVLQASCYARGGEIFILDMGKPIKVLTLAEKLIRLSGYEPYRDIEIKFTGLRPGEKLYEELLLSEEGTRATENRLIHIGHPLDFDETEFARQLLRLRAEAETPGADLSAELRRILPNYRSPEWEKQE